MLIREAIALGKTNNINLLDILLLLMHTTKLSKEYLLTHEDEFLKDTAATEFQIALSKRINNMPVQYITHKANFMGVELYVDENVLIPRCDSEVLVETAASFIKDKRLNVLDLCTGSGCLAIALKNLCPNINITGVDISPKAIDIARMNSSNVNFIVADIFEMFKDVIPNQFDVIISNPPYITANEFNELPSNVKDYEPHIALYGGIDGMLFYKFIAERINHKSKVFFEIGPADVKDILLCNKFGGVTIVKDLAGLDRVIFAEKE